MTNTATTRRGVALILVLWTIVVLGGIAAAVTAGSRSSSDVTGNLRARLVARYAAESGIVAAAATLRTGMELAGDDVIKRRAVLNDAVHALGASANFVMGDATVSVVMVDVSARLDVNTAPEEALAALFARAGRGRSAADAARAIRRHIDSIPGQANLFQSLDDVASVHDVGDEVIAAASPWLTVDGDGQVNRATASPVVLGVARGSLIDEPSRVLLIARGWQRGHPLTHEIQAVYAIQGNQLAFVRWRERDL